MSTWRLDERIRLGKDDAIVPLPQFKTMLTWELCSRGSIQGTKRGLPNMTVLLPPKRKNAEGCA
jgi:hypothetical protein